MTQTEHATARTIATKGTVRAALWLGSPRPFNVG
jgi:hypothetical protein